MNRKQTLSIGIIAAAAFAAVAVGAWYFLAPRK